MKLTILVSAILIIAVTAPATAQYTPPVNSKRKSNQSQATRGCEGNLAQLEIIAPEDENSLGYTASNNPTFIVYLTQLPPSPLIVTISQPDVIEPVFEQAIIPTQTGNLAITTNANLTEGKYFLTVGYFCAGDRSPIYARILFKKIPLTSEQEFLLDRETDRSQLLESWGYSYDAIAYRYNNSKQTSNLPRL
jgi:Domain of Unknown Function (DUF928)